MADCVGILAQDFGNSPQDFCTLERQHTPPFGECGLCHGHRRIDVLGAGVGDLAESDCPVPGLIVSMKRPAFGSCQAPP